MGAASGRKLTSSNLNHRACPNIGPLLRTAILSTRALFILEAKKAHQLRRLTGFVIQGHPCGIL